MSPPRISGSTTILQLLEMFPDGSAARLMGRLHWPCAQCGGRLSEPLSLAAKRHGNPAKASIECFRKLSEGGPSDAEIAAAQARPRAARDPLDAWRNSAARAAGVGPDAPAL
jgi:hypothetical protein